VKAKDDFKGKGKVTLKCFPWINDTILILVKESSMLLQNVFMKWDWFFTTYFKNIYNI